MKGGHSPPPTPQRREEKTLRRVHRSKSPPPRSVRRSRSGEWQPQARAPSRSCSADDILPLLRQEDDAVIPSFSRRAQLSSSRHLHRRSRRSLDAGGSSHHNRVPSSHTNVRRHHKGIWHYTVLSASFMFRATSILGAFLFAVQYAVLAAGINVEMKALGHTDWNTVGMVDQPQQQRLRQSFNMTARSVRTIRNVTLPAWVTCPDGRNVSSCHACAATHQDPTVAGCALENVCQWCPYGAALDSSMESSQNKDRSVTVYDAEGRITKRHDAHVPLGEQCVSTRQTCRPASAAAARLVQQDMELLRQPFFAEMVQKAAPHIVPKQCTSRGFQYCPYGALHSYHEALASSETNNNISDSRTMHRPPQCIPRRLHCQPPDDLLVQPTDILYKQRYGSAVVIPSHKFIFIPIPKVGSTVWYKLLRRMTGVQVWPSDLGPLPQNPDVNGLTYLADYSRTQATDMWTSPAWTKAMMVRDPKERLLSAYLDKVKHSYTGALVHGTCCPDTNSCAKDHRNMTLPQFVNLLVARECWNTGDHWNLQSERMERKYWPHVTTVLHLDHAAADARRLLEQVGAWEAFGATGWGPDGKDSIFSPSVTTRHVTNASTLVDQYYDSPALVKQVESLFVKDYKDKRLGFAVARMANSPAELVKSNKEEKETIVRNGEIKQGSVTKPEETAPKAKAGTK